jgi:hypothetical protein
MRRVSRIVLLAALVALASFLAGCESVDFDKLDFLGLNQKKPLPGDRKPVFPEGVPGVRQGIPKEYQKGYAEQQQQSDSALIQPTAEAGTASRAAGKKTAAVQPAEKPKPKAKPKRTVKRKAKPAPPATADAPANSSPAAQQQLPPWPTSGQQQQQQQQQQSSPWPSSGQQQQSTWPAQPPPGTSSR